MSDESEFEDPEWQRKYKHYMDINYLTLLRHERDKPMSKIELLTFGATKHMVEDKELLVVKLPFHTDNPFVFYRDENGEYYKW